MDGYELWRKEIDSPTPEERRLDRTTTPTEMFGFWRSVGPRLGYDMPVAIYPLPGKPVQFKRGTWQNDVQRNGDIWQHFLEKGWLKSVAVSEDAYKQAVATGFWPDGKPAKDMTPAEKHGVEAGGDNIDKTKLEESLAEQIKVAAEILDGMSKPTNEAEAKLLADRLDKMKILLEQAEAARVEEKEPHLRAGREIDAKWKNIGEPGGNAYRKGTVLKKDWLKDEETRLREEARQETIRRQQQADLEHRERVMAYNIRLEQWIENHVKWLAETPEETDRRLELEAENIHLGNSWLGRSEVPVETIKANLLEWDAKLRAEAKARAEAAAAQGINEPEILPALIAQAPPAEAPKVAEVVPEKAKIAGTYGRASSLKKIKKGVITDMALFLSNCAHNDKFTALAQQHANALARTGTAIDGMKIEEVLE
jgi:hypothetical protein